MEALRSGTAAVAPAAADLPASERGHVERERLVAVGGILGALAASSCCIVPLLLFSLGIGGPWVGNLTALAPYKPLFVAGVAGLLGDACFLLVRKPHAGCAHASP